MDLQLEQRQWTMFLQPRLRQALDDIWSFQPRVQGRFQIKEFKIPSIFWVREKKCFLSFHCFRWFSPFDIWNLPTSNFGYIWLGACFILIVFIKSRYFPEFEHNSDTEHTTVFPSKGLPQQNSLFYAMGILMIFQVVTIPDCFGHSFNIFHVFFLQKTFIDRIFHSRVGWIKEMFAQ